jgi:hypothetical protein
MGRAKIDAAQNDPRRVALKLEVKKFLRRAFFDPVAQSQELLFALIGYCSGRAFNAVHGVSTDGARHFYFVIHHREQHDHSVEVVSLKVTSRERHRKLPADERVAVKPYQKVNDQKSALRISEVALRARKAGGLSMLPGG